MRVSRCVKVGNLLIGGGNPVVRNKMIIMIKENIHRIGIVARDVKQIITTSFISIFLLIA